MPGTIARELEQERLHDRARQIERVMSALRDRAVYRHTVTGTTPPALRRAISDFGVELDSIRRRLSHTD
ncbi:MAG TPA: hypothetical protein VFP78_19900 [Solirubrobacteraceae bacterium]|nr:hypothetical protein [Solirubrobacteraceae bacterium]